MSAIFVGPIASATWTLSDRSRKKLRKPTFTICSKRLEFFGRGNSISRTRRRNDRYIMPGLNSARAKTSEEGVQAFEQEAFMEDSLNFGAGRRLEAALNNLSKWLVSALFVVIIIWRHDAEVLWMAAGAVVNAVLSTTLKKLLNQERPTSTLRSDPGMPSSHAQSIFYTITFLSLSMVEFYGVNWLTTTLSGLFFILGSYFSWLRVSQQFHTSIQVIVGAVLGSIVSIFWFWLWHSFVLNLFVSFLWVRIAVVLGAVGFCLVFLYHVYRTWIMDETDVSIM